MKYKAILFDFDYTLADSSLGIVTCFQIVLKRNNYTIEDEDIKRTIGNTLEDSFSILTGIEDNNRLVELREEYSKEASIYMTANTFLYPDTLQVLKELKIKGYKLGVISTKYRFRIVDFFEKQSEPELFDIIIGGEDVTEHKPSSEGLEKAIEYLSLDKNDIIYVGDSVIDAKTAVNGNVDFIGVTTGTTTKEEFSGYPHIKIVESLSEIIKLVI